MYLLPGKIAILKTFGSSIDCLAWTCKLFFWEYMKRSTDQTLTESKELVAKT